MAHDITCLNWIWEFLIRAGKNQYHTWHRLSQINLSFSEFLIRAGFFWYHMYCHMSQPVLGIHNQHAHARVCWLWSLRIFDPGWDFLISHVLSHVSIDHGIVCGCGLPLDPCFGVIVIVAVVIVIVNWLVTLVVVSGVEICNVSLVRLRPPVVAETTPRALNHNNSLFRCHRLYLFMSLSGPGDGIAPFFYWQTECTNLLLQ